ncbi:MAG: class I SAM-dependent RNA methyltransferase [Clostridiales Family XIII bacterium]|jgi:putative N6-adenine-specific DNA methylase|nr:class I SAM-dependent RNA methyltransferase [Clostridiales Family XIII bacterium]
MRYELIATATFGLEAVVKREVEALGYRVTRSEDGRITFTGNEEAIVRANLWLRSADRVYLKLAEFDAFEFEDLYQGVRAIPFEEYMTADAAFATDAVSVRSKLHAVPSVQAVCEKALADRLREAYALPAAARLSKTGAKYRLRISLQKDRALITLDTSGAGLHKRGYRTANVDAPIKETLAAAMVSLSFWNENRLLCDPFCGSGTIAIEAAMQARNIAPGLGRRFVSEEWHIIDPLVWKTERNAAYAAVRHDLPLHIHASDIDKRAIEAARENAAEAGVEDCIQFESLSFSGFSSGSASGSVGSAGGGPPAERDFGIVITNPPYGERIGETEKLRGLYRQVGAFMRERPTWSLYLITTDKHFEAAAMGRPADRRRKLYNGRLETTFYQYYGEKPPRM